MPDETRDDILRAGDTNACAGSHANRDATWDETTRSSRLAPDAPAFARFCLDEAERLASAEDARTWGELADDALGHARAWHPLVVAADDLLEDPPTDRFDGTGLGELWVASRDARGPVRWSDMTDDDWDEWATRHAPPDPLARHARNHDIFRHRTELPAMEGEMSGKLIRYLANHGMDAEGLARDVRVGVVSVDDLVDMVRSVHDDGEPGKEWS